MRGKTYYYIANIVWLFCGLAWLSTVIASMQRLIQLFISNDKGILLPMDAWKASIYYQPGACQKSITGKKYDSDAFLSLGQKTTSSHPSAEKNVSPYLVQVQVITPS